MFSKHQQRLLKYGGQATNAYMAFCGALFSGAAGVAVYFKRDLFFVFGGVFAAGATIYFCWAMWSSADELLRELDREENERLSLVEAARQKRWGEV